MMTILNYLKRGNVFQFAYWSDQEWLNSAEIRQLNGTGQFGLKGKKKSDSVPENGWKPKQPSKQLLYFFLDPPITFGQAQKQLVVKLPFVPLPSMNWMYVQYICKLVQNELKKNKNENKAEKCVVSSYTICCCIFIYHLFVTYMTNIFKKFGLVIWTDPVIFDLFLYFL